MLCTNVSLLGSYDQSGLGDPTAQPDSLLRRKNSSVPHAQLSPLVSICLCMRSHKKKYVSKHGTLWVNVSTDWVADNRGCVRYFSLPRHRRLLARQVMMPQNYSACAAIMMRRESRARLKLDSRPYLRRKDNDLVTKCL